jgi:hypothetical protein
MNVYETKSMAERLRGNSYVGRGLVIGRSADGRRAVLAYFIMGRSAASRTAETGYLKSRGTMSLSVPSTQASFGTPRSSFTPPYGDWGTVSS